MSIFLLKVGSRSNETQEEHPKNGQARNTPVTRFNVVNITHVFEDIEGRFTEKLSQESSWTEFCFLGALYKLDEFLLKTQVRTNFWAVPRTPQNTDVEIMEKLGERSEIDPHPEK